MTLPANATSDQNDSAVPGGATSLTLYRLTQFMVLLASVVAVALFWWTGKSLGIPAERGFDASVLRQPNWPAALLSIYVVFIVCLILGTLISGRWWFVGGLFAAAVGLATLSVRGGSMRYVLFDAQSAGSPQRVFISLALETVLLFIPIGLAWTYFWRRYELAIPARDPAKASAAEIPVGLAIVAQVVITGLIVLLFSPTDAKKQVLVSVFLGGLIGTALADYVAPHRHAARWYWVGPLGVGVIGYLLAYYSATPWTNGVPAGAFGALARALPLDYAGVGAAGALLGYWVAADRPRVKFGWTRQNRQGEQTGIASDSASNSPVT